MADQVYEAFDVSQPVDQPDDLRGREKELARLLSGVLHRRNHGVVSGPRGSGKTSLVRVFGQYADREGVVVLYAACDDGTTFGELLRDFLEQIPPSSVDADQVEMLEQRIIKFGPGSSPHQATSIFAQVKYSQIVIIVDEFDRVRDRAMHSKMASLLKLMSDSRLPVRLVLVGAGTAFTDVVAQHPSLVRHITRLSTDPLPDAAIEELLENCAARCHLKFSDAAKRILVHVACGSPYHARLFGMHVALRALEAGAEEINDRHVQEGLGDSFEEWASLNREDADTFRAIVDRAHGDPAAYVEVARRLATAGDERSTKIGELGAAANGHDQEQLLSAFGTAVEKFDHQVAFRDATAPQFFIALQEISWRSKNATRSKGRTVA